MRYTLYPILLISFLLFHTPLNAQNRSGNIWCFGYYNEVDFNSAAPTVENNSSMATMSGSASIADSATGQLLFYTDGISVWDNTNTQMPGNTTSLGAPQTFGGTLMPALIVPVPGAYKKYYIFTTGGAIAYTIIDMTLRGGLGDVSQQPTVLLRDTCARINGTFRAAGGTWVLVHLLFSNAFYAYPVTSGGIAAPVISFQGEVDSNEAYLKISPDGSMISAVYDQTAISSGRVEVFRFNNSSGVVSPPFFIDSIYPGSAYNGGPAGLTFSPNSNLLYVGIAFDTSIYQYNLSAGSADAILASRYQIGTSYNANTGASPVAMQISSDQKIYIGIFNTYSLAVINYPNVYGGRCAYSANAVSLTNFCMDGLPNFIDHIFVPDSTLPLRDYTSGSSVCTGSCTGTASVTAYDGYPPYTYLWQPDSLTSDSVNNLCAGTYYVKITDSMDHSIMDSINITALVSPQVTITGDTVSCASTSLCATSGYDGYNWDSGQGYECIYTDSSGVYSVTVTGANGCSGISAPLTVVIHYPPAATGNTSGNTLEVSTNDSVTYQWYINDTIITGATNYLYDSTQVGDYKVILTDTNGCKTSVLYGPSTGIMELEQDIIQIYPNPSFSSIWQLSVNLSLLGAPVEVFDLNGQCVYRTEIQSPHSIFTMDVAKGIYFLYVHSPDGIVIKKLIRM